MRQSPGAIQALEWSDKALFGLVSGGHRWHLKPQGKKLLGIIGKNRTQVTLDQEITGGLLYQAYGTAFTATPVLPVSAGADELHVPQGKVP